MIDVVSLIRGRREQRAGGIEELAHRLAGGEVVAPEEIEAILDRTGCTEEQLQSRIDALVRRNELVADVKAGEQARRKVEKIEAEIAKAFDAVVVADNAHRELRVKHADELLVLGQTVDRAARAHDELLNPDLLAHADRESLADARKAASEAASAHADLRRQMPELRLSLEQAERAQADAADEAKRFRSNPDVQDRKTRADNAVKARRQRVADAEVELKRLEQVAGAAEAALVAVETSLRR